MGSFSDSMVRAWQLVAGADPVLLSIVARSLAVSGTSCAIGCVLGLLLGAWLGVTRFGGRGAVLAVLALGAAVLRLVPGA